MIFIKSLGVTLIFINFCQTCKKETLQSIGFSKYLIIFGCGLKQNKEPEPKLRSRDIFRFKSKQKQKNKSFLRVRNSNKFKFLICNKILTIPFELIKIYCLKNVLLYIVSNIYLALIFNKKYMLKTLIDIYIEKECQFSREKI